MSEEGEGEGDLLDTVAEGAESAANAVVAAFTTPEPAGPSGSSIGVAVNPLKAALKAAFKTAKEAAHSAGNGGAFDSHTGADPIIDALGEAMGSAIHDYFMNAWVDITGVQSVAMPPVMCETVGIAPIRPVAAGATIVPIIPVHHALPGPSGGLYGVLK